MSDLFAEVELPSDSHLQTATKKSAVAQKARGFNPAQALRGISSKTPDNGGAGDHQAPASACTTRGDGRYSNGSNLVQVGNKVHIGPEAFTQGNIEETFRELDKYGAFGKQTKGKSSSGQVGTSGGDAKAGASDVRADGLKVSSEPPSSSNSDSIRMAKDLESILALSEKIKAKKLEEEGGSEVYDIAQNEEEVSLSSPSSCQTVEPEYQLKWFPNQSDPERLDVHISMPAVSSISEVTLTVLGKTLSVSVSDKYKLKVSAKAFRGQGQDLSTRAKWKKEKRVLKVILTKEARRQAS